MAAGEKMHKIDNWIINLSDKRKIVSPETGSLRAVRARKDKKRNRDVRSELKIFNLTERRESQNEYWYEHIARITTGRLQKI
jgi:hypothetical protein